MSSDPADRADLLERAGLAADAGSHTETAVERLMEASDIWHALGEREREARAIGMRGRAVINGWRAHDAIAFLEPALAAFEDLGDDPGLVLIEHQLARAYWFEEDHARAVPLADRALGRAERLDDIANVADILVTKGALISTDGRPYEGFGSMEAGRALAEERGLNSIVARALLNMAGSNLGHDPRHAFELGMQGIALARRIGFRSFLATAAGNSLEVSIDLGELDWAMAIGDELLALDFGPADRHSLLRGIEQVRLLRGEPVDELYAEHAAAAVDAVDLQVVSNYEGAAAFRRFIECDFAEAAELWEKSARLVTLNAAGDLPRVARAAIWAGDLPTAERLTAEYAKDWVHGRWAPARLAGLTAGIAAMAGRRDEAVAGYATALAALRELRLEVDAVLTILDMARTVRGHGSGGRSLAGRGARHDRAPPDAGSQRPSRARDGERPREPQRYPTCPLGIVWYAARQHAERRPLRRQRPPPEGSDDRPARPPIRGRGLGDPAGRRVPDGDTVARRRRPGVDRRECRVRAQVFDLWRRLAAHRDDPGTPQGRAGARVPAAVRAGARERGAHAVAARVRGRARPPWPGASRSRSPGLQTLLATTGYCLGCKLYFLRWWVPDVVTRIWTRGRSGGPNRALAPEPIRYR